MQEIRFELYPESNASYQIFTSRDGRKFDLLQDNSRAPMNGWQEFRFRAQPVKAVKMVCTKGAHDTFSLLHFEAYCYLSDGAGAFGQRGGRGRK